MVKKQKLLLINTLTLCHRIIPQFILPLFMDNYSTQLVRNRETRWNYITGFKIRDTELTIGTFGASKTREENRQES